MFENSDLIKRFCRRWGFDERLMNGSDDDHRSYRLENNTGDIEISNFEVRALRLKLCGRFGNYVMQILNMLYLAEKIGIKFIILRRTEIFALKKPIQINGIWIAAEEDKEIASKSTILTGVFLDQSPFGSLYNDFTPEIKTNLVDRYLYHIIHEKIRFPRAENDTCGLVIHIRSGDIFSGDQCDVEKILGSNFYTQPPLSFYVAVIERVVNFMPMIVTIVAEDDSNPVIHALISFLNQKKIAMNVRFHNNLVSDICIMMQSEHIVFANGSIGMAIALLSRRLKNAYMFWDNGTGLSESIYKYVRNDINTHVFEPENDYIKIGDWKNNMDQRMLMLSYPPERIRSLEPGYELGHYENIALNQSTKQSSRSIWSAEDDGQRAVNGYRTGEFGFHTDEELNPWFEVILKSPKAINLIMLFNRLKYAHRSCDISIYGYLGEECVLMIENCKSLFGGVDGYPLRIVLSPVKIDRLRLVNNCKGYFHLDQIELYALKN